jgi:serine/threonine protein kinase
MREQGPEIARQTERRLELYALILGAARSGGHIRVDRFVQEHPGYTDEEVSAAMDLLAVKGDLRLGGLETGPQGTAYQVYLPRQETSADAPTYRLPADYQFVSELGRGGSGIVLLVDHLLRDPQNPESIASRNRRVLKMLKPGSDTLDRRRFRQEILLLHQGIHHPGVVELIDAGETPDGALYFVMPYYDESQTLDRLLLKGRLEVAQALRIASQVAAGLVAAHAKGFIHRDIKPSNILVVGPERTAMILDFGIAKHIQAQGEKLTQTNEVFGTPSYMAPERALGSQSDNPAVDVYSLGATIYEMLTGRAPFEEDDPAKNAALAVMERARSSPVQFPESVRASIPPPLQELVADCMQKDPAKRPELAQVKSRIEALKEGLLVPVSRPLPRYRVAVLLACLAIVAGIGIFLWSPWSRPEAPPTPMAQPREPTLDELVARAKERFERDDLQGALSILNPLIGKHSENLPARDLRARVLFKKNPLGNASAVLQDLEICGKLGGMDDSLHLMKAYCHYCLDDLGSAQQAISAIKKPGRESRMLAAKTALRLVDPQRALAELRAGGANSGLVFDLADASYRVQVNSTGQSPQELALLARDLPRLQSLQDQIQGLPQPDYRLSAAAVYHQAVALRRLGVEERSSALFEEARRVDPAFRANLVTPALDLAVVAEIAWSALEEERLEIVEEFLGVALAVTPPMRDKIFAPLENELRLVEAFLKGDLKTVLAAYSGKEIPAARNVALAKVAARLYSEARFEEVDVRNVESWEKPRQKKEPHDAPDATFTPSSRGMTIETAGREAALVSKSEAQRGYEASIEFQAKGKEGLECLVVSSRQDQGETATLFLRFRADEMDLARISTGAAAKVLARAPAAGGGKYTASVLLAGEHTLVYVNGRVFYVLPSADVDFPRAVECSAIQGTLTITALRLVR